MEEEIQKVKIVIEKSKDYHVENYNGTLINANMYGEMLIEFYEDIAQPAKSITFLYKDGENTRQVEANEVTAIRSIHTGIRLSAQRLPELITELQEKYNQYLEAGYVFSMGVQDDEL